VYVKLLGYYQKRCSRSKCTKNRLAAGLCPDPLQLEAYSGPTDSLAELKVWGPCRATSLINKSPCDIITVKRLTKAYYFSSTSVCGTLQVSHWCATEMCAAFPFLRYEHCTKSMRSPTSKN